jgi:hypothetical protein
MTRDAVTGRGIMNLVPGLVILHQFGDFSPACVFKWRSMTVAVCREVLMGIALFGLDRPGVS